MRFVTYISALPKKYQAAAERMSNLIQEDFDLFYGLWRQHYIKSKEYWTFPAYIGHNTCLNSLFGPKNSDSKKYYIFFMESGRGIDFFIHYKKKGNDKHRVFACVILDKEDWYFRPRGEKDNSSNEGD